MRSILARRAAIVIVLAPRTAAGQRAIAFTHVTIIDGADSTPRRDQTVVVRGSHIAVVESSRAAKIPSKA
jgi:hypothetical protein